MDSENQDEDAYNKVLGCRLLCFDKVLEDNIEACDILEIKNEIAYFLFKNGFNTSEDARLYIQIILSGEKDFSSWFKNNQGSSYLQKTLKAYNKRNKTNKIDTVILLLTKF